MKESCEVLTIYMRMVATARFMRSVAMVSGFFETGCWHGQTMASGGRPIVAGLEKRVTQNALLCCSCCKHACGRSFSLWLTQNDPNERHIGWIASSDHKRDSKK